MKIAYLVPAHNNPQHLLRLIRALTSSSSAIFIHVDRKSSLEDFAHLEATNVHLSHQRIPVYWGDFSQVEATLLLLRLGLAEARAFDYFVLLSGTDYPLRSVSYIEGFFEHHNGKEFMDIVPMGREGSGKPISRLTTYMPRRVERQSSLVKFGKKVLMRICALAGERDYRAHLRNIRPYGGSSWWALSRAACEYIQYFVASEPKVVNFFKNTVCPDESLFQTILGNSPYRNSIQRNLTYADWSGGGRHPALITEQHVRVFESTSIVTMDDLWGVGEALFARKFSDDAPDMVTRINELIQIKEGIPTKDFTCGLSP